MERCSLTEEWFVKFPFAQNDLTGHPLVAVPWELKGVVVVKSLSLAYYTQAGNGLRAVEWSSHSFLCLLPSPLSGALA